ncbi:hypothetical protein SLA2020_489020 [Shorea laevis]
MKIQNKRHLHCALLVVVDEIQTAIAAITTMTTRRWKLHRISFRSPLFPDVIYGVVFIVFEYLPQCFVVGIGEPVMLCLASESGKQLQ